MSKLIYFHGFGSSGESSTAKTLKELLRNWTVMAPDIPVDPAEALPFLKDLCEKEKPDVIVGTSLGGAYAQQMVGFKRICINPALDLSRHKDILHRGIFKFFSPRQNGRRRFVITSRIINHFSEMEKHQFDGYSKKDQRNVYGLFGTEDNVVDNLSLFKYYYDETYSFRGGHRLSRETIQGYLIDLINVAIRGGWYKPYGFREYPVWPTLRPMDVVPDGASFLTKEELERMRGITEQREHLAPDLYRHEILKGVDQKYAWVGDFYRPSTGHRWTQFSFTEPFDEKGDEYDNDLARVERKRVVKLCDVPTAFFETIAPKTIY